MTPLKFHPAVYQDIADAYNWYQLQLDGLGDGFINELESAYSIISQMPQSWPKFGKKSPPFSVASFSIRCGVLSI